MFALTIDLNDFKYSDRVTDFTDKSPKEVFLQSLYDQRGTS